MKIVGFTDRGKIVLITIIGAVFFEGLCIVSPSWYTDHKSDKTIMLVLFSVCFSFVMFMIIKEAYSEFLSYITVKFIFPGEFKRRQFSVEVDNKRSVLVQSLCEINQTRYSGFEEIHLLEEFIKSAGADEYPKPVKIPFVFWVRFDHFRPSTWSMQSLICLKKFLDKKEYASRGALLVTDLGL